MPNQTAPNQTAKNRNSSDQPLIFLDLDGVLSDFQGHAQQENKLKPNGKIDYEALDYEWWKTMPAFEGAREFYDGACKEGFVRFLTGPILNEACYAGKARWVQDFVRERGKFILEDLIICDSENKFLLAAPGRILVDDRVNNIKAWEAAGGIGILHAGDYKDTMKQLQEAVIKLAAVSNPSPAKKPVLKDHLPKFH